jgi:hypothetical protein
MLNFGSKREELGKNELFGLGAGAGRVNGRGSTPVHRRFYSGFFSHFHCFPTGIKRALK